MHIYSTLKKTNRDSRGNPETITAEYSLNFIAGNWHLSRAFENDYVRFGSCQWGSEDTARIVAEMGLHYPETTITDAPFYGILA